MATEKVEVIEGDGSSDRITVTDDPVENATVQAVKNVIGDETTASEQADSTVAATLLERVTALVDVLTSGQADDELRVALATDLLSGSIDVDVAAQSAGNIAVELAADSLTGNLDVDLAAQTSSALDVSGATVPTEPQTPIKLESSTGTNIDPATEQTVSAIKTAAQALDDALASNGGDEVRVTSPSPLDVSAATVTVTDDGSLDVNSMPGTAAEASALPSELVVVAGDDGTDTHPLQLNGDDLKAAVEQFNAALPAGNNNIGSVDLAAQSAGLAQEATLSNVDTAVGSQSDASENNTANSASLISWVQGIIDTLNNTLTVTDDGSFSVSSLPSITLGTDNVGVAKETTASSIDTAIGSQSDASESNTSNSGSVIQWLQGIIDTLNGTLTVQEGSAVDVSASEVDVDLNSQTLTNVSVDLNAQSGPALDVSGATVTITDNGAFTLAANDGVDIGDVGIEDISPVTGQSTKANSLPVTLASDEDTVPTEQQTPVGVEDSQGTQVDPATDPAIKGGASLQDIIDAVDQGALAQITATEEGTLLTDATTAQSTPTQTNTAYKGVIVWVNIDSISGSSPSLTAKVQRESPGGTFEDVLSTGGLSNSGLNTLEVHPSLSDSSNQRAGQLLGRDWRVDVTLDTADGDESYQYDIEYTYIE